MKNLLVMIWWWTLLGSCTATGPDPAQFGTVKIALGAPLDPAVPDWREDQRLAIEPLARELDILGPDFQWTEPGDPESIVIRPAALPRGVCGFYRLGETMVEVDPTCTEGFAALRKAAAHELVHALLFRRFRWAGHLCWYPINSAPPPTCHRSLVCRDCLMSPEIQGVEEWADSQESYSPTSVFSEPQASDIALFSRCYRNGACE